MRVCIVNEIANCGFHLAKGLTEAGHDVMVVLDADKQQKKELRFSQETIPEVDLRWIRKPTSRLASLYLLQKMIREIRSFRPDIIHVNYLWTHFFISAVAATLLHVPLVGVAHGWDILVVPKHTWRKWFQRLFLRRANRIFLTAKYFSDALDTVPPHKQVYTPRTIDTDRFHPGIDSAELRERFGKRVVTSVARLYDTKAHDKLLRAFSDVVSEVSDAQLLMIGDGPEKEKLVRLSKKLKLQDNVHFLGRVPNTEIAGYLSAANVEAHGFAMPALGISHLEAMACGTPVITYTGKERYEGVISAYTEEEIANAAIKILNNKTYAEKLGEKARKYVVANFGLEASVRDTLAIYEEIIREYY